jgi:uncharacterized protein
MFLKYLVIAVVIYLVYVIYFKPKPAVKNKKREEKKLQDNDMVECAECHTFVSIDEVIYSGGKYFCSKTCMEKHG